MKQHFLFVFITFLSAALFAQIDTNNKYTLIQKREYDQFIDSNFFTAVDTNLDALFHFDSYSLKDLKFNGTVGGGESMLQTQTLIGNLFGEHVFLRDISSATFYKARIPFLRASFVQGPKQFQKFDVEFSENIDSQFGITIDYQSLKSTGFYLNQNIDRRRFGLKSYYLSKNGSISSVIGFRINSGLINENGGIADAIAFRENINGNKVGVQVSLEQATNQFDDRAFFYDQEVRLFNFIKDSSKSSNGLFVFNRLETHLGDYWFSDFISDSITDSVSSEIQRNYYNQFGQALSDSIRIVDQYKFEGLRNFAAIRFKNSKIANLIVNIGINFKAFRTFNLNDQNYYQGKAFKSVLNRLEFNRLKVSGELEIDLDGYNVGGVHADGQMDYTIVDSLLSINGGINFDRNTPSFKSLRYNNTIVDWDNYNSFNMVEETRLNVRLISERYTAFLSGSLLGITNYVYYNDDASATQYSGRFNLLSLRAGKKMEFGDFHLDIELRHQQKIGSGPLNTPEWVVLGSLYHQRFLFSRALEIKYGFDYWQSSSYYADSYAPFIREYVYQNEQVLDSYPFIDFYIGIRVKTVQGFVKAQNLCQTFLQQTYMMVPDYPLNDFSIMFGVQWDFFN